MKIGLISRDPNWNCPGLCSTLWDHSRTGGRLGGLVLYEVASMPGLREWVRGARFGAASPVGGSVQNVKCGVGLEVRPFKVARAFYPQETVDMI